MKSMRWIDRVVSSWSVRSIVLERRKNLGSRPIRGIALVVSLSIGLGAVMTLEIATLFDAVSDIQEANLEGENVYVALPAETEGQGIDAAACTLLSRQVGFVAAGPVAFAGSTGLKRSPDARFRKHLATRQTLEIWLPGRDFEVNDGRKTVYLGEDAADEIGVGDGQQIDVPVGQNFEAMFVGAILGESPRNSRLGRWLIGEFTPTGTADECWIEVEPGVKMEAVASVARAYFGGGALDVTVQRVGEAKSKEIVTRYASRGTRYMAVGIGAMLGFLGAMSLFTLASERALYSIYGMTRVELSISEIGGFVTQLMFAMMSSLVIGVIVWELFGDYDLTFGRMWQPLVSAAICGSSATSVVALVSLLSPTSGALARLRE